MRPLKIIYPWLPSEPDEDEQPSAEQKITWRFWLIFALIMVGVAAGGYLLALAGRPENVWLYCDLAGLC